MQLLQRMKAGDERALNDLFARYLSPLQRWSRGRLPAWARDMLDTDDLVQETLLQTLRGVGGFEPRHTGAFQAYLRRAVLNRIHDEVRRAHRKPLRDGTAGGAVDPRPSPVEETIGREALGRYEAALERLKPESRDAVVARLELGFSYKKIAVVLGKPSPDAARMVVQRAMVQLARAMSEEQE